MTTPEQPQQSSVLENEGAVPAEPAHRDDLIGHPSLVLDKGTAEVMAAASKEDETAVVTNSNLAITTAINGAVPETHLQNARNARTNADNKAEVARDTYEKTQLLKSGKLAENNPKPSLLPPPLSDQGRE